MVLCESLFSRESPHYERPQRSILQRMYACQIPGPCFQVGNQTNAVPPTFSLNIFRPEINFDKQILHP